MIANLKRKGRVRTLTNIAVEMDDVIEALKKLKNKRTENEDRALYALIEARDKIEWSITDIGKDLERD